MTVNRTAGLLAATLFILTGCASSPAPESETDSLPVWVTELPRENGWIYGVGSAVVGEDPATAAKLARQRARLDMLEGLQIEVSGSSQVRIEQSQDQVSTDIIQNMKVDIPETSGWQIDIIESHEAGGQIFVLAGLDRRSEASRIRQMLADLNMSDSGLPEPGLDLRSLMAVKAGVIRLREWQELQKQHLYVAGRYDDPRLPAWYPELARWADYLQSNLRIQVQGYLELDQVGGWPVVTGQAPLILNLNLSREQRIQQDRAYYFIVGDVRLSDASGFSHQAQELNARGISSLPEKSRNLAQQELSDQIRGYVDQIMPLLSDLK